ncbi:MAG: ArsR/SmtB family transcription factor [Acidimicrobiia bacterium]
MHVPDYDIADVVRADTPSQLKALGDATRMTILGLLLERSATTSQLAEALSKPKGTVGYHLNVLADNGFVRVVRTRKVRAMTEKYYGRTGRTIVMAGPPGEKDPFFLLKEVMREARIEAGEPLPMFTLRRGRIPTERAVEFAERIAEIAEDFTTLRRGGDTVYGFVAGVYPTNLPTLPPEADPT